jgi:dihydropteroate synthase
VLPDNRLVPEQVALRRAVPGRADAAAALARMIPQRDPGRLTRLLGILNLTPDSFYDGGRHQTPEDAADHARALAAAGADALDLGAESSRPGARAVSERQELDRLLPVLEQVVPLGVPVSVDTVKAGVARSALAAGASLVNDISALTADPDMAAVCAQAEVPVILMHMRGTPRDMQSRTDYDDVVTESLRFLETARERAVREGIREDQIILDPGIGFAKTAAQNLQILRRLGEYEALGCPILVGASRKSFLDAFADAEGPEHRLPGTLAASALAVLGGALVLRVHDVAENAQAVRAAEAILNAPAPLTPPRFGEGTR